jgi:hypothetical protein
MAGKIPPLHLSASKFTLFQLSLISEAISLYKLQQLELPPEVLLLLPLLLPPPPSFSLPRSGSLSLSLMIKLMRLVGHVQYFRCTFQRMGGFL